MGIGESDEGNLERMRSFMSLKNWRNKLASDCLSGVSMQGMNWKGCNGVLNSSFPKCVRFFKTQFCVKPYVPRRTPKGPK